MHGENDPRTEKRAPTHTPGPTSTPKGPIESSPKFVWNRRMGSRLWLWPSPCRSQPDPSQIPSCIPKASYPFFRKLLMGIAEDEHCCATDVDSVIMRRWNFTRDETCRHFRVQILDQHSEHPLSCVVKLTTAKVTAGEDDEELPLGLGKLSKNKPKILSWSSQEGGTRWQAFCRWQESFIQQGTESK